jgi:hypothetical protein
MATHFVAAGIRISLAVVFAPVFGGQTAPARASARPEVAEFSKSFDPQKVAGECDRNQCRSLAYLPDIAHLCDLPAG